MTPNRVNYVQSRRKQLFAKSVCMAFHGAVHASGREGRRLPNSIRADAARPAREGDDSNLSAGIDKIWIEALARPALTDGSTRASVAIARNGV